MTDDKQDTAELTPMDQIRQAETEAASRIAEANLAAEHVLLDARERTPEIRAAAEQAARTEGERRAVEIVEQARAQAAMELDQARQQAERLRRSGAANLDAAVRRALELVIGSDDDA